MTKNIIKLSQVYINESNPRQISKEKLDKLIASILVLPKMLSLRPIVVDEQNTVLGGNMRVHALQSISELSADDIKEILVQQKSFDGMEQGLQDYLLTYWDKWIQNPTVEVITANELSEEEKRQFVIKDNVSFGKWDWDILANEWDTDLLEDWGLDLPITESEINMDDFFDANENGGDSEKTDKLTITIPEDFKEQKDEIKARIEELLCDDYQGIKVR